MTHSTTLPWMGEPVVTLGDVWPTRPRAVIVGVNSTPTSVASGHHHQGQLAQRQLFRLADAGLFRRPEAGRTDFEDVALEAGIGIADMVKRPTCAEKHLSLDEIRLGRDELSTQLEARGVGLVICVFRRPVELLLGVGGQPGFQPRTTSWGARVLRMPGPFAPAHEVDDVMAELTRELGVAAQPGTAQARGSMSRVDRASKPARV